MAGSFGGEVAAAWYQGNSPCVQCSGRKEDAFYLLPLWNWTPCVKMKELENIFVSHLQALNVHHSLASVLSVLP